MEEEDLKLQPALERFLLGDPERHSDELVVPTELLFEDNISDEENSSSSSSSSAAAAVDPVHDQSSQELNKALLYVFDNQKSSLAQRVVLTADQKLEQMDALFQEQSDMISEALQAVEEVKNEGSLASTVPPPPPPPPPTDEVNESDLALFYAEITSGRAFKSTDSSTTMATPGLLPPQPPR